jgi:hypothetical protein
VYLSRLVKTRDLYPGLLQFATLFRFFLSSLPCLIFFVILFLFCLYSLIVYLVEVLPRPFHSKGDLVLASLVSENPSHVLQATQSRPSRTNG